MGQKRDQVSGGVVFSPRLRGPLVDLVLQNQGVELFLNISSLNHPRCFVFANA